MDVECGESEENSQKNRDQIEIVVLPKQGFVSFQTQVSSSFQFHAFLLVKLFLYISYFTFTVPFRITKSAQTGYTLHTNIIQTILSTVLIVLGKLYFLLKLKEEYRENSEMDQFETLDHASSILQSAVHLLWFGTFWLNKKLFMKLLDVCQGRKEQCATLCFGCKMSRQMKSVEPNWYIRGIVYVSLLLTLSNICHLVYGRIVMPSSVGAFDAWYHLHNIGILKMRFRELNQYPFWCSSLGFLAVVLGLLNYYQERMFSLFCFIGAAMVNTLCADFYDQIETQNKVNSEAENFRQPLRSIQTSYVDLSVVLETINKLYGNLVIIFFFYSFPISVSLLFEKDATMFLKFRYCNTIAQYVLFAFAAAEGNSKVQQFKQWLLHTSFAASTSTTSGLQTDDDNQAEPIAINEDGYRGQGTSTSVDLAILKMLHLSTDSVGLTGYKFFTVTYGFIGTV